MVRSLLNKPIRPVYLALGDEADDLGSSPSWANIFLLFAHIKTTLGNVGGISLASCY